MNTRISGIVCAYNEAPTLHRVLDILTNHPAIYEVILVDDASEDTTFEIAKSYPSVRVFRHSTNMGKSTALATAFSEAEGEYLLTIDADLIGLDAQAIDSLIQPVLLKVADITISVRKNSLSLYRLLGLDFVSGERLFPTHLVAGKGSEIQNLSRFGFEVFFNRLLLQSQLRLASVVWSLVINKRKKEKVGFVKGTLAEIKMISNILTVVSPWEIVAQNYLMLKNIRATRAQASTVMQKHLRSGSK